MSDDVPCDEMGTPRRALPDPSAMTTAIAAEYGINAVELTCVEEVFRMYRNLDGKRMWQGLRLVARKMSDGHELFFRWPRYGTYPYSIGMAHDSGEPQEAEQDAHRDVSEGL